MSGGVGRNEDELKQKLGKDQKICIFGEKWE